MYPWVLLNTQWLTSQGSCRILITDPANKNKTLPIYDIRGCCQLIQWCDLGFCCLMSLNQATQSLTGVASERYSRFSPWICRGGHFLFRGQKHDARCTCCCLLQDVLLCLVPTFFFFFIQWVKNRNQPSPIVLNHKELSGYPNIDNNGLDIDFSTGIIIEWRSVILNVQNCCCINDLYSHIGNITCSSLCNSFHSSDCILSWNDI